MDFEHSLPGCNYIQAFVLLSLCDLLIIPGVAGEVTLGVGEGEINLLLDSMTGFVYGDSLEWFGQNVRQGNICN